MVVDSVKYAMTYAESAAWAVPAPRVRAPVAASGRLAARPRTCLREGWVIDSPGGGGSYGPYGPYGGGPLVDISNVVRKGDQKVGECGERVNLSDDLGGIPSLSRPRP